MKAIGLMLLATAIPAAALSTDVRVEFRDCPKCDKRIRVDIAANKAYVNVSRLEGAILADGACAFTADINVAGVFESRDVCRAATLALAEVALASRPSTTEP